MEIVEFDLYLARKISNGEIEGRVLVIEDGMTHRPMPARIVCYDRKSDGESHMVVLIQVSEDQENLRDFLYNGRSLNGTFRLVLEIPFMDDLKPGDIVKLIDYEGEKNVTCIFRKREGRWIELASNIGHNISVSNYPMKKASKEEADSFRKWMKEKGYYWDSRKLQIMEIKREKVFSPFEKVLVFTHNKGWQADFFSKKAEDRYFTTSGRLIHSADDIVSYNNDTEYLLNQ